jgi:hypothetical protein
MHRGAALMPGQAIGLVGSGVDFRTSLRLCSVGKLCLEIFQKPTAIPCLSQILCDGTKLVGRNPTIVKGNFLGSRDKLTLPMLQHLDEFSRFY